MNKTTDDKTASAVAGLLDGVVMPEKLTKAQERTLKTAINDRSIIIGGIDATPDVRRDVVYRLYGMGYLQFKAPHGFYAESEWVPTEKAEKLYGA